jgi:hypothetical protein
MILRYLIICLLTIIRQLLLLTDTQYLQFCHAVMLHCT